MDENIKPWDEPKIAMIISIFDGRVSSIKQINEVMVLKDEEIPR